MFHTSVNRCQANGARRSKSVWKTPKRAILLVLVLVLLLENPCKIENENDDEDQPVRRVQ